MTAHYRDLLFTQSVQLEQEQMGSRSAYARSEGEPDVPDRLGPQESLFIGMSNSFYMSSIGSGGWPYIQHRGGRPGFVKVLNEGQLGFADFRGNRQYISLGNIAGDNRVALFFMDYPRRARLKLLGRMKAVSVDDAPELAAQLSDEEYPAKVERLMLIDIEAFDWNCSQHITQRFTAEQINEMTRPMRERLSALESEIALLKGEN
jgi:uncharacterized protein